MFKIAKKFYKIFQIILNYSKIPVVMLDILSIEYQAQDNIEFFSKYRKKINKVCYCCKKKEQNLLPIKTPAMGRPPNS